MKALALEMKDKGVIKLPKGIKPAVIKSDDPFFSSEPVDIGHTNNGLIDKVLYGIKCRK